MPQVEQAQFEAYVAARLVPLRRLAYLMCGDWHLAEDATSTVMAKLYVAWHRARLADDLNAYVRRMLVRALIDERRRPWRREHPAEYPLTGRDARPAESEGLHDRLVLREALSRMPPKRRAILVLRYFEVGSVRR